MLLTLGECDTTQKKFAVKLIEECWIVEKWDTFYKSEALLVATEFSCAVCTVEEVDGR